MAPAPLLPTPGRHPRHPLGYLARYRLQVLLGVACLVVVNGLAQATPWVVKWIIEGLTAGSRPHWLVALLLGMAVTQGGIRILSRVFIFNAGREAEYDLRATLFARFCQLNGQFYRSYRVGDLMSRLTNDLSSVRALYGPGVLHIVNTVFAYGVGLPMMLRIDPWMTLWALAPYAVLLLGTRFFARGIYGRSQEMQASLAGMTSTVQENLSGIRELKSHRLEEQRAQGFGEASAHYLDRAMRLAGWRAGLIPFMGVGAGVSIVVSLYLGGSRVIDGQLSLGDLVAFNLYLGLLAWPTMAIGWMLSLWQRGISAWHRLVEIIEQQSALEVVLAGVGGRGRDGEGDRVSGVGGRGAPEIEVRGLTVRLGDKDVLKDVSFTIPAGTVCAVVGRVGSGKSTLAEALARLLEIPPGAIFVGGEDVTRLEVGGLRDRVAYAPQSAFLFSRSIRENVAMGLAPGLDPAAGEGAARVEQAVRLAGLEPDMDAFPDGLETVVGERGLSISGGQRQRIALARALAAHRPVIILDDSLSAVDAETEKQILQGLGGVLQGRTGMLISHRLSALRHADQVVVLDGGRVAEAGGHEELLERGGLYADLYRKQLLSELGRKPDMMAGRTSPGDMMAGRTSPGDMMAGRTSPGGDPA